MYYQTDKMTDTNPLIRSTFSKEERLCYQKSIDRLFAKGKSFIAYPLRIVYFVEEESDAEKQFAQLLISVPKRKFKRANKRNRVKRLVREAYRLNKEEYISFLREKGLRLEIAFLYLKDELPTYEEIEKSILKAASSLKEKIEQDSTSEKTAD